MNASLLLCSCQTECTKLAKIGGNPALVSLYSNAAARAFEPFGKTSGQVSYETSLAQVRGSVNARSQAVSAFDINTVHFVLVLYCRVLYVVGMQQAIHWQRYITDGFPVSDTEVGERRLIDTCSARSKHFWMDVRNIYSFKNLNTRVLGYPSSKANKFVSGFTVINLENAYVNDEDTVLQRMWTRLETSGVMTGSFVQ